MGTEEVSDVRVYVAWWTGQRAKVVKAGALCAYYSLGSDFPNGFKEVLCLLHAPCKRELWKTNKSARHCLYITTFILFLMQWHFIMGD